MRPLNEASIGLIKSFEGFRALPYVDAAGLRTVGYGHKIVPQDGFCYPMDEGEADALLRKDAAWAADAVESHISSPLGDNQFGALVSLVYNAGTAPLLLTLGRLLNAEDYVAAAQEFLKWNHVKGAVCDGLTRRRQAEMELFMG